jgi:hypothetical protein
MRSFLRKFAQEETTRTPNKLEARNARWTSQLTMSRHRPGMPDPGRPKEAAARTVTVRLRHVVSRTTKQMNSYNEITTKYSLSTAQSLKRPDRGEMIHTLRCEYCGAWCEVRIESWDSLLKWRLMAIAIGSVLMTPLLGAMAFHWAFIDSTPLCVLSVWGVYIRRRLFSVWHWPNRDGLLRFGRRHEGQDTWCGDPTLKIPPGL